MREYIQLRQLRKLQSKSLNSLYKSMCLVHGERQRLCYLQCKEEDMVVLSTYRVEADNSTSREVPVQESMVSLRGCPRRLLKRPEAANPALWLLQAF